MLHVSQISSSSRRKCLCAFSERCPLYSNFRHPVNYLLGLGPFRSLDVDLNRVLAAGPGILDFLGETLGVGGKIDVRLLVPVIVHEGEFFAVNVEDLPVVVVDDGNVGIVFGRKSSFELFSGEDILGGEGALGLAVFSGLGFGNVENLAWSSLDHNVAT